MIGDRDLAIPAKMLELCALRHKVIANNIANAEVKDFRRVEAEFSKELTDAIATGDAKSVQNAEVTLRRAEHPGVNAEAEVSDLTRNSLLFEAFSQIANYHLRMMRTAIGR